MGGNRTPGSQGAGTGGVPGVDGGTLARTRSCPPGPTNGNSFVKQEQSWCLGAGQTPVHQQKIGQIFFPTNGSQLDGHDRAMLAGLCSAVAGNTSKKGHGAALLLVGMADHRGDPGYNLRLAARRALAVKRYIHSRLPGAIIWARTLGEAKAKQPDLCGNVSQQRMAEERVVDVIYARYRIIIGDDVDVVLPKLDDVIEDAKRIVSGKKTSYPNQSKRLLCYLNKLKGAATAKNDGYWSYGDWLAGWKAAYKNGRYNQEEASKDLKKRRRSARNFLKLEVALQTTDERKFQKLILLDTTIFNSYQKVADRLRSSGTEKVFPYWIAVKNWLVEMLEDRETLYSCIAAERKSVWEYFPF